MFVTAHSALNEDYIVAAIIQNQKHLCVASSIFVTSFGRYMWPPCHIRDRLTPVTDATIGVTLGGYEGYATVPPHF